MVSDFSDYGPNLTVLCSNITKKSKKIKRIIVYKRFLQIIVVE